VIFIVYGPPAVWRLNFCLPFAICASHSRSGIPADVHSDIVTGFRPAPDRVWFFALEHHTVAENRADKRMPGHFLTGRAATNRDQESQRRRHTETNQTSADFHGYPFTCFSERQIIANVPLPTASTAIVRHPERARVVRIPDNTIMMLVAVMAGSREFHRRENGLKSPHRAIVPVSLVA
jgi:hypothetical protein